MPVITPSVTVRVTVTSLWKPSALPIFSSPAGASAGNRLFTAVITALEVKVAPATTSAVKGPFLPMNWLRKASSVQGLAMASVSPEASTTMVAMVPSSFRVMVTFTSDSRPLAEAVSSSAAAGASAMGSSSPATDISAVGNMLFRASITPWEVKVAPATISAVKGPFLPMNWPRKASVLTMSHTGGICLLLSMVMAAMVPSSFRVMVTPTSSPMKPGAAAVIWLPAGAASSAGNREFTAVMTALEVKVAPDTTSAPSKGPFLPMNWLRKASSVQGFAIASVSPEASTVMVAMVPSSFRVMVTFTSDSRPLAEAVLPPSTGAASSAYRAFTASITALEVKVAPATTSAVKGAALPMN